uniref:Uncharacterized protein n=1 Tax=Aegilops tauschii subsp. strangulata TaxID=200361 RepID=A0A453QWA0_AEGTS
WPCPVLWGEPPAKYRFSSSVPERLLTSQQKKMAAKLLGAHSSAVDLRTYPSDTKLAEVFSSNIASPPPGPALDSTGAKGKLASETPDTWFMYRLSSELISY